MKTPKKNAAGPEELDDLERFHERMKDEAQAWRNLLGNMDRLKTDRNPGAQPPGPPGENPTQHTDPPNGPKPSN
ncbi:MAG: hypothetical protein IPN44_12825 [Flavobacteriales bacterium]|nr:hypothetical protein [Flavobacteriales bacterium]